MPLVGVVLGSSSDEKLIEGTLEVLEQMGIEHEVTVASAHRTATLLGCDQILVLDQGRVVERGAPGELLEREGSLFGAMHARQRLRAEILEA